MGGIGDDDGDDFLVKGFPQLFLHNQQARAPLGLRIEADHNQTPMDLDISPIFPQYQLHVAYNFLSFDDDIHRRRLMPATKEGSV